MDAGGGLGIVAHPDDGSQPAISCNNVWNNEGGDYEGCSGGVGAISANPLFVDEAVGDYHLQLGSPCIDTGDPNPQYNDPDGTRNDMGAYGGPGAEVYHVYLPIIMKNHAA